MANIAITNICNLQCPYCFAEELKQEEKQFINEDKFTDILEWLEKSKAKVSLIGGEPTLHPSFLTFVRICDKYSSQDPKLATTIFTNGIELGKYFKEDANLFINGNVGALINCNSPELMTEEQWKKFIETLDICKAANLFSRGDKLNYTLGCNIYPVKDYSYFNYFWELVEKYQVPRVRVSCVSPCGKYACYRDDKDEYFNLLKPYFIQFCEDARKHNCTIAFDCSYIPACYFNADERRRLFNAGVPNDIFFKSCLNPVIDIAPDATAISCFGGKDDRVNIFDFEGIFALTNYFFMQNRTRLYTQNPYEKCNTCHEFIAEKCQGGCLAFANGKK